MKLGIMTVLDKDLIEFAGRAGFACVEGILVRGRTPFDLDTMTEAEIAGWEDTFKRSGVTLDSIAYFHTGILSADEAQRRDTFAYFQKLIKLLKRFGGDKITFGSMGDKQQSPAERFAMLRREMPAYVKVAEDEGVKLCFENCPGLGGYPLVTESMCYSPELWDALFDAVPSKAVGLEFDPSHLVYLGIDYLRALKEYAPRIFSVHAKDTEIDAEKLYRYGHIGRKIGGGDMPFSFRLPGYGLIDWGQVFKLLYDARYDGPVFVEHEDNLYDGERRKEGFLLAQKHLEQFML